MFSKLRKIDEVNTLILRELLKDGRKSFVDIAKQCHLTKSAIAKRFEEMKKAGIIVGSTIQIDAQKFGYGTVAYINTNVEPKYLDSLFAYLNKIPELRNYRCYTSTYNLNTIVLLKQLKDLEYIKYLISKKCPVNEITTYLWIEVRNIPENILPASSENETDPVISEGEKVIEKHFVKLDDLNIKIVEKLVNNSRISFRKVAQELGTTTRTISKRYENLRNNNYIKPSIQINTKELGFKATLHIYLAIDPQKKVDFIVDSLSKILGISYIVKISGDYDLQVAAMIMDYDDSFRIYEKIAKIPDVKKIEMRIIQLRPAWPGPRQHISTF